VTASPQHPSSLQTHMHTQCTSTKFTQHTCTCTIKYISYKTIKCTPYNTQTHSRVSSVLATALLSSHVQHTHTQLPTPMLMHTAQHKILPTLTLRSRIVILTCYQCPTTSDHVQQKHTHTHTQLHVPTPTSMHASQHKKLKLTCSRNIHTHLHAIARAYTHINARITAQKTQTHVQQRLLCACCRATSGHMQPSPHSRGAAVQ